MELLEVFGVVTGALSVALAVAQRPSTYPVGIANSLAFLVLFSRGGLYAGAVLQVVYVVLGVLGWVWWVRGGPGRSPLRVRATPRWGWWAAAAGAPLLAVALWAVLARSDDPAPVADAGTTALSLVAQLMLDRKVVGTWWVWVAADVWLVALYARQGLHLTALLYAGFTVLCVAGWWSWRAELRRPALTAPRPVGA